MIIILVSMIYVIGFIATFVSVTLSAKKESRRAHKEGFPVVLLMSWLWPILVILMPIVFGFCFLNEKYNQFVGRQ